MRYLFFFIIIFLSLSLEAQSQFTDLVHLQNGSILRCRILEYKPDDIIKIEIQGGSVLVYKAAEVLKIDRNAIIASPAKEEIEKTNHIYFNELYFSAFMNILGGYKEVPSWWGGTQNVPTLGIGFKFSGGKAVNRHLMLGAGVAWSFMNNYFMFSSHIPIFAELRGDMLKKNNALYYSFQIGYNAALMRRALSWSGATMTSAKGGFYVSPAIGLRLASRYKNHFSLEFGYGIHTASYTYTGTNGEIIGPTKNTFFRPTLSVGFLF